MGGGEGGCWGIDWAHRVNIVVMQLRFVGVVVGCEVVDWLP